MARLHHPVPSLPLAASHSGEKLAPTLPQFTLRPEVKIEDLGESGAPAPRSRLAGGGQGQQPPPLRSPPLSSRRKLQPGDPQAGEEHQRHQPQAGTLAPGCGCRPLPNDAAGLLAPSAAGARPERHRGAGTPRPPNLLLFASVELPRELRPAPLHRQRLQPRDPSRAGQGMVARARPRWDLHGTRPHPRLQPLLGALGWVLPPAPPTDAVLQCGAPSPARGLLRPPPGIPWLGAALGLMRAGRRAACTYLYRDLYILYRERLYRYIYNVP